MKIDILSDVHFDNYFYGKYTNDDVIKFYSQIIDFITPPINNLNYGIMEYGKNRCKKIITKRVV